MCKENRAGDIDWLRAVRQKFTVVVCQSLFKIFHRICNRPHRNLVGSVLFRVEANDPSRAPFNCRMQRFVVCNAYLCKAAQLLAGGSHIIDSIPSFCRHCFIRVPRLKRCFGGGIADVRVVITDDQSQIHLCIPPHLESAHNHRLHGRNLRCVAAYDKCGLQSGVKMCCLLCSDVIKMRKLSFV